MDAGVAVLTEQAPAKQEAAEQAPAKQEEAEEAEEEVTSMLLY